MEDKTELDLSKFNIAQLGFVYKDVRKQAKMMETFFGIPKFTILGPAELDTIYRGKKTKYIATGAFGYLFNNVEIELIQFEGGESIHKEFLDEGKEGFHHIRYDLDDLSTVVEKFKSEGIGVLQSGSVGTLSYVYMDTEPTLGIIIEFSEQRRKKRIKK